MFKTLGKILRVSFKLFFFLLIVLIVSSIFIRSRPFSFVHDAVGVVEITGEIYDSRDVLKDLRDFKKSDGILGVIVRIDSPGGTVAASQELYQGIKELSAVKPVIASMGSVAASGGYYAACGAPFIVANPGTITGSIGVRIDHVEIGELLDWAKVHYQILKSGEFKDMVSFHKPLTLKERELVEVLLQDIHLQFKTTVSEARQISMDKLSEFADGRVLSGAQAKALNLVDELGGFPTVLRLMQEILGLKEEPELIYAEQDAPWWIKFFSGEGKIFHWTAPGLRFSYQM